jgi:hypothetical protein
LPAASNVVINDGATTPVAHTFTPIGKDAKGVLNYEQTTPTTSTPLEAKKIGYRQTRGTASGAKTNGNGKLVLTVSIPRAETLSNNSSGFIPAPTLAYELKARVELDLPERSTAQERKDLRALTLNALTSAFAGPIDTLTPIY